MNQSTTPVLLSFASHDPTGCGGASADIETAASLGCHPAIAITALAARDTRELKELLPVDAAMVIEQARALLEDMPVAAIKVGELASVEQVEAIHSILRDYPRLPVVLDASSQGVSIHRPAILQAIRTLLLPQTLLLCARPGELQSLAPEGDSTDAKARLLLDSNCKAVQLAGLQHNHQQVTNRLYQSGQKPRDFHWPLPQPRANGILGANPTLSAAVAAFMAHGSALVQASEQAQHYAAIASQQARRLGMGKLVPNRLFWAQGPHKNQCGH